MKLKICGYVILAMACSSFVAGCAKYKERFGGKSGNYENAETIKPLVYPKGKDSLKPSTRYAIPKVKSSAQPTKEQVEKLVTPPDYR